jgi:phosphoserine phosphatase
VTQSLPEHVNTDKEAALRAVRESRGTLVLDFDYTLYCRNSTEDYLGRLRPAWLAYAMLHVIAFLVRVFGPSFGRTIPVWRDYLWVHVAWFLFPWAGLTWPRQAARLARKHANRELLDAVRQAGPRRIIVISFGFAHIQRPMLAAMGLGDAELIAATAGWRGKNLRVTTKAAAVRARMTPEAIRDAVFVTDSKDDLDLMELFPNAHCVAWAPRAPFPLDGVYVPFRYTAEGKYAVPDILWNQHFTEDLVVVLIAYTTGVADLLALPLLFVSFFCVYEMGYYENNTLASRLEDKPTVAPGHARFSAYPIFSQGTVWAAATGIAGCALCPLPWPQAMLVWAACLIGIRIAFRIFNTTRPEKRLYIFPWLQIGKTFSYAPLFGVTPAGALLLFAQIMRQTTNYCIYRCAGNTRLFRRQAHRLLLFGMLSAIALLAGCFWETLAGWRFVLALCWCVYRALREAFGPGLRPLRLLQRRLAPSTVEGR